MVGVRIGRGLISAAVAGATLAFAAPALATTRYVGPSGTNNANVCTDPTPINRCATITYAITQAQQGDSISVAPGTYDQESSSPPGPVPVTKRVHLVGAAAGQDARSRKFTSESIVPYGFNLLTSGVSIDGFDVSGSSNANPGISTMDMTGTPKPGGSGFTIANNRIKGFVSGVYLGSDGTSETLIRHNLIDSNNTQAMGSGGYGIFADLQADRVRVEQNAFSNNPAGSIVFLAGYTSALSIAGNTSSGDGPLEVQNVHDSTISGNTVTNNTGASGITLAGGNADLDVTGNVVTGSAGSGVALSQPNGIGSNGGGISITGNDLDKNSVEGISVAGGLSGTLQAHFNRIVGNSGHGLRNDSPGPVDASENWWGCNDGPNKAGCDTASGSGTLTSEPYLVLAATAERGRILTNGDTNRVTAGFGFDSAANAVDPSAFPPTLLAFNAALGSVSPIFVKTSGGVAQTLYTAGSKPGSGSVTAHADNAQTPTAFVVSSQAGPPGPPGSGAQPNPVLILSNSLRATKQRIVSVSISCPVAAGLCDGRLGIGAGSATLGNVSFLVQGGNKAVIRVPFTKSGVKRAIKRKKVTIVVLSRDNAGTAALTTKVVQFRK